MQNHTTKDVQAILHEIVNDLEKTSAGLSYLSAEVQKLSPRSRASITDAIDAASHANRRYYNGLRKKVEALE
jgi:hypothetical protein